ncbi:hypothetical protein HMPREF3215_01769 [Staphylococcus simulans]|nr:hypothetical protein HMPREF3215_01769 [Staphylococcus simulans]
MQSNRYMMFFPDDWVLELNKRTNYSTTDGSCVNVLIACL